VFETAFGIPAHPLFVHAPVVLIPLLILVTLGFGLVPPLRSRLDWAVVLLGLAGPGSAFLARLSGEAFQSRLVRNGSVSSQDLASIANHQHYGNLTFYFSCALGGLAIIMVLVQLAARRRANGAGALAPITFIVFILAVASAGATGYYVFKTGDSGAHIVWQGR